MNNRIFKRAAISLVAVASVFALSGNNVNARVRHYRYHYRTKYRIRRNRWHRSRRYRVHGKRFVWHAKHRRARKRIRRPRKYRRYRRYYRKYRKNHVKKPIRKRSKKHRSKRMSEREFLSKLNQLVNENLNIYNKANSDNSNSTNNSSSNSSNNSHNSKNIFDNNALYNTDNVYNGDIKYPDGSEEKIDTPKKIRDNEFCADLQTLNELNADRKSVNKPELTWDPDLTEIANKRAKQLESNFTHYDNSNNAYYMDKDARSLGFSPNIVQAENIAKDSSTSSDSSGNISSEVGPMAADDMNLNMFNYEKGSTPSQDGGHRVAIESPQDTKVGIGTAYNPNNYTYYTAEEFGGTLFD